MTPAAEPVQNIVELGSSFLVLLGGGGVVITAICAFVSKTVADHTIESHKGKLSAELERLKGELARDAETYKLKLKKAELLFDKQVAAANAFIPISHKLRPEFRHADMDWHEASEEVAQRSAEIVATLTAFQLAHGAAISAEARTILSSAITTATHTQFEDIGPEPSDAATKAGSELLTAITSLEDQLIADLRA